MSTLEEAALKWGRKSYHAQRISNGGRCDYLASTGRRCRRTATWSGTMHGDPETNDGWAHIECCDEHAAELFKYDTWYRIQIRREREEETP